MPKLLPPDDPGPAPRKRTPASSVTKVRNQPKKDKAYLQHALRKAGVQAPLDFMLEIMRDKKKPMALRMDAAKASAEFVHAKLARTIVQGDVNGGPIRIKIEGKVAGVL